jgi:hypothetical protein
VPKGGLYGTQRQLLEALRRRLAEPGPSRFADETLYGFLDEAAHEVAEDTGCVTTALVLSWPADTVSIDIQDDAFDFVQILGCYWIPTGSDKRYEIEIVSNEKFFDLRANPASGIPTYGAIVESYTETPGYAIRKYLRLWPTPSGDGTVRIIFTILPWSVPAADRATTVIPIRRAWRDLVIIKALAHCYENLGRPDLKEQKEREYERMLSGVRLKILDYTTSSYEEMFDGHNFGYV